MEIHPDITKALTPPGDFYTSREMFQLQKSRVFARSWQFVADVDVAKIPNQVYPFTLLEGCLDEPLLITRDSKDELHCISNVCTHRGNIVCESGGIEKYLRCRYHGRRFGLDGKFQQMPEFEDVENFPSSDDDLSEAALGKWKKFFFVKLEGQRTPDVNKFLRPMDERIGWMPIEHFSFEPVRSREYLVRANWALYCDNYLEGFHIPFIHAELNEALDYGNYTAEIYDYCNLQLAHAKSGEDCFDLPKESPDHGKNIAAYYFWLFPNTMLNFYPWGLSINIVRPLAHDLTKISFLPYVWDRSRLDKGAGAALDRVEREDEAVVELVHRGLQSHLYKRGRYSPTREKGTHHFHLLLAEALK